MTSNCGTETHRSPAAAIARWGNLRILRPVVDIDKGLFCYSDLLKVKETWVHGNFGRRQAQG